MTSLQSNAAIRWLSDYLPEMKISPSAARAAASVELKDNLFAVQLFDDAAANQTTLNLLKQIQLIPAKQQNRIGQFINLIAALPPNAIAQIAERDDVISITRYSVPRRLDERQNQIIAGNLNGALPATGTCVNIPAAAKAVVGNATVVNANTGYLTFWPSNATQPLVATSNFLTGQVFNRHFTVGLGADGAHKRYSSSATDLVIDLSGYFAP